MGDLKKWVSQKWVDIGAPKKDGKYQPCGRKSASGSKRKYPKCVPLAKATRMTSSQKASAVRRKRAAGNPGGKPTNVATFAKRKKAASGGSIGDKMIREAQRNYKGSYISGDLGGVKVSNPSLVKYYGSKIKP
tara:strand:- start:61 stop:459 length:399 start_codon:yes stop_codon:yes gene_type:complete